MKTCLVFTLFFISLVGFSQEKHIQLNLGLSPTAYKGDLNSRYSHFGFGWNSSINIINNKFVSSSIQLSGGSFTGSELNTQLSAQPTPPTPIIFPLLFLALIIG